MIQKSLSVAVEPFFSQFIEKLKPDVERLRLSNDFGVKIYNRLIKQYPQLSSGQPPYKVYSQSAKKNKPKQKNPNKLGAKMPKKPKMDMYYEMQNQPQKQNVNINININANFSSTQPKPADNYFAYRP